LLLPKVLHILRQLCCYQPFHYLFIKNPESSQHYLFRSSGEPASWKLLSSRPSQLWSPTLLNSHSKPLWNGTVSVHPSIDSSFDDVLLVCHSPGARDQQRAESMLWSKEDQHRLLLISLGIKLTTVVWSSAYCLSSRYLTFCLRWGGVHNRWVGLIAACTGRQHRAGGACSWRVHGRRRRLMRRSVQTYTAKCQLTAGSISPCLNSRVPAHIFTPSNTQLQHRTLISWVYAHTKCVYLAAIRPGSCLVDSMESVGNVFKEKTKFLNTMYVYHTVRKPGYILEFSAFKPTDDLYRCVHCKRLGKTR